MQDNKIKILYYGDSPSCATGFGTVSRNILMPLYNTGNFDITVLGVNYWGMPHDFPFPIYPVGIGSNKDPYGREVIQKQIAQTDFDILFMLQDSFILEFAKDFIPKLKASGKKFKSMVYFPIDGTPKRQWVQAMNVFDYAVTYTQWGRQECIAKVPEIAEKLCVIPHGVNLEDYFPLPLNKIIEFRSSYFGAFFDKFIWCNINRNQQRKDIPKNILAFKKFLEIHPDSVLYLHMCPIDQGWNLPEVVTSMGLTVGKDVVFPMNFEPNAGYPRHIVNMIYNSVDCVMSTTLGEGWGLSTVESMATKTPILFPANTSLLEIIGKDRGVLVDSGEDLEHYTVLPLDNEVLRPVISVEDLVAKMCLVYENDYLRSKVADNAYNWVINNLIWDKHITPKWKELIMEAYNSLDSLESNVLVDEL